MGTIVSCEMCATDMCNDPNYKPTTTTENVSSAPTFARVYTKKPIPAHDGGGDSASGGGDEKSGVAHAEVFTMIVVVPVLYVLI